MFTRLTQLNKHSTGVDRRCEVVICLTESSNYTVQQLAAVPQNNILPELNLRHYRIELPLWSDFLSKHYRTNNECYSKPRTFSKTFKRGQTF